MMIHQKTFHKEIGSKHGPVAIMMAMEDMKEFTPQKMVVMFLHQAKNLKDSCLLLVLLALSLR